MIDPDAFAALLCDWCLEVEPGHQVMVVAGALAEPLVRAMHRAILDRDAWPLLRVTPDGLVTVASFTRVLSTLYKVVDLK